MKKIFLCLAVVVCVEAGFAQPIPFRVNSYLISSRQTASQYEKAELSIDDETQSWEIVLYRKDNNAPEKIKLEGFREVSGNGVFRDVSITENNRTSHGAFFGYIPEFGKTVRIDLCDARTERTRRRLELTL